MPIYVYQALESDKGCSQCREPFEIMQGIKDAALSRCDKCAAPIHRIICAVGVKIGKKHLLSEQNLRKKGFTKLVNEGDGKFRKIT